MKKVQINHKNKSGAVEQMAPKTIAEQVVVNSNNANIPQNTKTVGDIIDSMGTLAFANGIDIPDASADRAGVVKLSNETDNEQDEASAATAKAVGLVNKGAVHKTGDEEISGTKIFKDKIGIGNKVIVTASDDENGNTVVDFNTKS